MIEDSKNLRHFDVVVLGAGQDVGRSCVVVTIAGRRIMFDCGMHMGYCDERRFPDFGKLCAPMGEALTSIIDCVIITHFHLDHCGALPHLTEVCGYDGPIYMSSPTAVMSPLLLKDYVHVMMDCKPQTQFYSMEDVDACMRKITPVALGETIFLDSELTLTSHYAGHVLGAAMFSARCAGQCMVYTGDFNTTPDRHLGCARIDRVEPDLLITETTYATTIRESKRCRESDFLELVHATIEGGGKVLIPSFALGRAQELLVLLETYWDRMLMTMPIYFSTGMVQQANLYYELFSSWTSAAIQDAGTASGRNMLAFRRIKAFEKARHLHAVWPCVLFATPGMLHAGVALEAFRAWACDPRNMVLFPSFCAHGTVGHALLRGIKELHLGSTACCGTDPPTTVRCTICQASFSAHADAKGILGLVRTTRPAAVIMVHGERHKMAYLKTRLQELYGVHCFDPRNGESCRIAVQQMHVVHFSSKMRQAYPTSSGHGEQAGAAVAEALDGSAPLAKRCRCDQVAFTSDRLELCQATRSEPIAGSGLIAPLFDMLHVPAPAPVAALDATHASFGCPMAKSNAGVCDVAPTQQEASLLDGALVVHRMVVAATESRLGAHAPPPLQLLSWEGAAALPCVHLHVLSTRQATRLHGRLAQLPAHLLASW